MALSKVSVTLTLKLLDKIQYSWYIYQDSLKKFKIRKFEKHIKPKLDIYFY